jgi:hypothetical protein
MNTTIGCPIPGASQPKEPVRLIEASNVMEAVFGAVELYDSEYFAIQHEIEKLPTIDPESMRPTAKWIEAPDEGADGSWEACSRCAWESRWAASKYKYCPHCGARMVNADE